MNDGSGHGVGEGRLAQCIGVNTARDGGVAAVADHLCQHIEIACGGRGGGLQRQHHLVIQRIQDHAGEVDHQIGAAVLIQHEAGRAGLHQIAGNENQVGPGRPQAHAHMQVARIAEIGGILDRRRKRCNLTVGDDQRVGLHIHPEVGLLVKCGNRPSVRERISAHILIGKLCDRGMLRGWRR